MTSPDEHLASLFAADLPPARDARFQAEVAAGVARREFLGDLMALATLSAVMGALAWVLWPVLSPTLQTLARSLEQGLICAIVAGSVVVMARARFAAPGS